MIPAVTSVNIPFIRRMVTDGRFAPNPVLTESGAVMLDELSRWVADLKSVRRDGTERPAERHAN
jgi:hypothetical protein